jgi:hypothetical protein
LIPQFTAVPFSGIESEIRAHLATLPNRVDSFFEAHIFASNHYRILVDGAYVGFASIHGESLITQFSVVPNARQHGQALFAALRRLEKAQFAFVPTCDEFFLSHALDVHRSLVRQAYFFIARDNAPAVDPAFTLRPARPADVDFIVAESGDFLDPVAERIDREELFITLRNGTPQAFGIREVSKLQEATASIGMFTPPTLRQQGAGAATIGLLIAGTRARGMVPIAGCWYYNHASKKTLERAGMATSTRLLKIEL